MIALFPTTIQPAAARPRRRAFAALAARIVRARKAAALRETLRVLAQLEPHRLADIGLTRGALRQAIADACGR